MKSSKFFIGSIICTLAFLTLAGGFIGVIDPFFHYHKPIAGLSYTMDNARYQNDGILKHFDYDTLMIGTSLMANAKTTDCDRIFGGRSVKTPYFGASFKETGDQLKIALKNNPKLKRVIRTLEPGTFTQDKDYVGYEGIPYYMYDNNPFNDVQYIFNREIATTARNVLQDTRDGKPGTTFDEYLRWHGTYPYGRENILAHVERPKQETYLDTPGDEEIERTRENIRQNLKEPALNYPDTEFYYYFTPPSVVYWDIELNRKGMLNWYFNLLPYIMEELTAVPNIHLYSFDNRWDITDNLDLYYDPLHFTESINRDLLLYMAKGEGLITGDNYKAFIEEIREFYTSYDYDSIYE